MNRLSIAAIAAILVAVIGGGIVLTRGGDQGVGGPRPSTSTTPVRLAAPAPPCRRPSASSGTGPRERSRPSASRRARDSC